MAMSGGSNQFGEPIPGMNNQGTTAAGEYDEDIKFVKETGAAALKTGWSYLAWGASKIKEKSDESGVSSKLYEAKMAIKTKADE
jgi:hypothetical protein